MIELFSNTQVETEPSVVIDYTDNRLAFTGRWNTSAYGKWSGWQSSSIKFKVRKTSSIKVTAYIERGSINITETLNFSLVNDYNGIFGGTFEADTSIFSGQRTLRLNMINDGSWYNVLIYANSNIPANLYNLSTKIHIQNIIIDGGGEIDLYPIGVKNIQCIGDSWMASSSFWQRAMNVNNYNFIQIAGAGYQCSNLNTTYDYDYSGSLNTTDLPISAVIISFGVNELNAGVSVATFQTNLLSLIDKVRLKQPSCKIFLVRVPDNTGASKAYGQYGTAMSNITALRSDIIYIDTTSIESQLVWADTGHLEGASRKILSDFSEPILVANGI